VIAEKNLENMISASLNDSEGGIQLPTHRSLVPSEMPLCIWDIPRCWQSDTEPREDEHSSEARAGAWACIPYSM